MLRDPKQEAEKWKEAHDYVLSLWKKVLTPKENTTVTISRDVFVAIFRDELEDWASCEEFRVNVELDSKMLAHDIFDRLMVVSRREGVQ